MEAELSYELSDDLLRTACQRYAFQVGRMPVVVGVALPLLAAFWLAVRDGEPDGAFWVFVVLLLAWPAAYVVRSRARLRRAAEFLGTLPHRRVTLRLSDDGIEAEAPFGRQRLPWRKVEQLWRFPEVWLLVLRPSQFYVLPTALLTPDLSDFVTRKVREHGARVA